MSRRRIPGLSCFPVQDFPELKPLVCVGFDAKVFTIPAESMYGHCRPITDFQILRTLADGEFGTVYKVRDIDTSQVYALKKLKIPETNRHHQQGLSQTYLREITNLKRIQDLNVLSLKEVVVGAKIESTYLLLEYCEYSLENVIENVNTVYFQHQHIKNIMLQLMSGLKCMHHLNIIHRNLNPSNVMFTEEGILKICDLGSSRDESKNKMTPAHALRWYRSPEILFGSNKYTKAVDIWAVGCIFAEMLKRKILFRGRSDGDIVRSLISIIGSPNEYSWPGFSKLPVPRLFRLRKQPLNRLTLVFRNETIATVDYLKKFLRWNPASRPSVEEVMQDPYYLEYPQACSTQGIILPLRFSVRF